MPVHNQTSPNGAYMCIPAVWEVKTMQLNQSNYKVPINTNAQRPAERRARRAISQYQSRLVAADRKYAADQVRLDGTAGPYVQAL